MDHNTRALFASVLKKAINKSYSNLVSEDEALIMTDRFLDEEAPIRALLADCLFFGSVAPKGYPLVIYSETEEARRLLAEKIQEIGGVANLDGCNRDRSKDN